MMKAHQLHTTFKDVFMRGPYLLPSLIYSEPQLLDHQLEKWIVNCFDVSHCKFVMVQ